MTVDTNGEGYAKRVVREERSRQFCVAHVYEADNQHQLSFSEPRNVLINYIPVSRDKSSYHLPVFTQPEISSPDAFLGPKTRPYSCYFDSET